MTKGLTGSWTAALFLASALGIPTPAAFAAEPNCRAVESTSARLSCYDAAFPPKRGSQPRPLSTHRQATRIHSLRKKLEPPQS